MVAPVRLTALIGAAAILTLAAPFDTGTAMRALPRFAYWAVIVIASYSIGYWANMLAETAPFAGSRLKRILISALVTSLGVTALIYLLNGLALDYWPTGTEAAILALNIAVISSIITVIFQIAEQQNAPPAPVQTTIPLLDRLPLNKRGPLVSISVEDHYVRIRTTKAEEMILMRLTDAIRETGETGLHVHRSHWIATAQVTAATRKGDGALLTMTHGPDIPVSRANVAKIKEAGLLPR